MTAISATLPAPKAVNRVISVDALRGFDMFWIVGADGLARALGRLTDAPVAKFFATQLEHVSWDGFVFYDLIFPLFVFLLGMSIVFSLDRIIEKEGMYAAHMRIVRRFSLLFLMGALKDSGIADMAGESPFNGVLQRMAWCYLITSLLYCNLKRRGLIAVCALILVGYWVFLSFVPSPAMTDSAMAKYREEVANQQEAAAKDPAKAPKPLVGPHFYKETNIVSWFDSQYLPFREAGQKWDPEGMLSTIPAIASCLFGVFAGYAMRSPKLDPKKRALALIGIGIGLTILGYTWGLQMPVIKRLWTSSYVFVAGGYSCMLVGLFSLIVDVYRIEKWAVPFIWIGANPLAIYLADDFINFDEFSKRIVGGPFAALFGTYAPIIPVLGSIVCVFLFARFLYKHQIFLRV